MCVCACMCRVVLCRPWPVIFPHLASEAESLGSALHSLVLLVSWILAVTPISTACLSTGVLGFKCTWTFHMAELQGYNTDNQAWVASTFSPWALLPALFNFLNYFSDICMSLLVTYFVIKMFIYFYFYNFIFMLSI